jgi:hypothetical protein
VDERIGDSALIEDNISARIRERNLVSNVLCPTNREHPIPGPTSVRTALASTALGGASLAPDDVPESQPLLYPADDGEASSL